GCAGQIDEPGIGAGVIGLAGVPGHHVGVDVDGVDRVGNGNDVVVPENVENVAGVALGSVGNENFIRRDVETGILVFDDGLAQEGIALLGTVPLEGGGLPQLVDGLVHGLAAGL